MKGKIKLLALLAADVLLGIEAAADWDSVVMQQLGGGWEEVAIGYAYDAGNGWRYLPEAEAWIYVVDMHDSTLAGFALIPAGSFEMGDTFGEGNANELPVHTVFVSAFYMGRTEVTKAQWDAVREWAINSGLGYTDLPAGGGKGPTHPVHSVNWFDAVKWLNAWSEKDGLNPVYRVEGAVMRSGESPPAIDYAANGYRLPTEAEWEKAARGGLSGKRFPWGDTISHSQANYHSSSFYAYDISPTPGNHPDWASGVSPYTSPVGAFAANGYGLHDMAGNVWEWCGDWWSSTYYSSSPTTDPTGPASGSDRVNRGGSWNYYASNCRVAGRSSDFPGSRVNFVGFRPARSE